MEDNKFEDLTSSGKKIQKDTRKREKENAGRCTKKASKANYAKKKRVPPSKRKQCVDGHHHHQIARKLVKKKDLKNTGI